MMNKSIAYAEVYEILSYMDKSTVMKIPVEILNMIKENRDKHYKSRIDKNDIFNNKNVEKLTLSIIAWLDLNYWATEEEKRELTKIYVDNERKTELEKQEKYGDFKLTSQNKEIEKSVLVKKESAFEKIIKFFKNLFK